MVVKEDNLTLPKRTTFSSSGLKHDMSFYHDYIGDHNNLAFPKLYYKCVPKYHSTYGSLGGSILKKVSESSKKIKPPRYFGKRASRRLTKPIITSSNLPGKGDVDGKNPLHIYDPSTLSYIHGQKASNNYDKSFDRDFITNIDQCRALLNEKLRKNPSDIQRWLAFVKLQDMNFVADDNGENVDKKKMGNQNQRALLERKMSILDKALELNPHSVELISTRLQLGADFWDRTKLEQEWKNTLFLNPESSYLWKKYIAYTEGYFESFTTSHATKAYATCFEKLLQVQNPSFLLHQKSTNDLQDSLIDVFSSLCNFFRKSGLTEKAVSLVQAIIYLNFNQSNDFTTSLRNLNEFWESAAPRVGELKLNNASSYRQIHETDLSIAEEAIIKSDSIHYSKVWHKVEQLRDLEQWQAWSSNGLSSQEVECIDPERSVSFDDISPFLFLCERKDQIKFRLLVGCIQSLGVPLLPACQANVFWSPLTATEDDFLSCLKLNSELIFLPSSLPSIRNSPSYLAFMRRLILECRLLLGEPFRLELTLWWLNVERVRIKTSENMKGDHFCWKDTKNWLKNLLKSIQTDDLVSLLMLYSFYADIEDTNGNAEESGRILLMLLSTYSSNPLTDDELSKEVKAALIYTWFSYVRHLLTRKSDSACSEALSHLVALGVGSSFSMKHSAPSPATILKAKKKFETLFSEILSPGASILVPFIGLFNFPDVASSILNVYSYFLSITEGQKSAEEVVQNWLLLSKRQDYDNFVAHNRFNPDFVRYHVKRESAYLSLLHLLTECRAWVKDFKPRLFYDVLTTALQEYPKSVQLLTIFIESEERCSILSSLWKSINTLAPQNESVAIAACLALIHREETIKTAEERTSNLPTFYNSYRFKIENLLENCLSRSSGRDAFLWRMLMKLSYLKGDVKKCIATFYRSVRSCPWSKTLYMDAIAYVPHSLKEVVGLLLEKELRLRFPVEELDLLLEEEAEDDPEVDRDSKSPTNIDLISNKSSNDEDGSIFSDEFENSTSDVEVKYL